MEISLIRKLAEYQRGIGAAKAEVIGHYRV